MLHLYIEQTPQALNVCGVFILCSHTVDYASYPGLPRSLNIFFL